MLPELSKARLKTGLYNYTHRQSICDIFPELLKTRLKTGLYNYTHRQEIRHVA